MDARKAVSTRVLTERVSGGVKNLGKEPYVIYGRSPVRNPSTHARLALHVALHSCRHGLKVFPSAG